MSNKELNLNEWIEKFDKFEFSDPYIDTQIKAGWYDWFCKDESLANKTKVLGKKLKMIVNSPKLTPAKQYVFFKNNCPVNGSLYDDIRICDIASGDIVYTISPRSGHKSMNGDGEVWGPQNNFNEALFTGKWGEIKKWFNE